MKRSLAGSAATLIWSVSLSATRQLAAGLTGHPAGAAGLELVVAEVEARALGPRLTVDVGGDADVGAGVERRRADREVVVVVRRVDEVRGPGDRVVVRDGGALGVDAVAVEQVEVRVDRPRVPQDAQGVARDDAVPSSTVPPFT